MSAGPGGVPGWYRADGAEVVLKVQVVPGSSIDRVVGRHGDSLRVRVAAAAEGGKANRGLERLLANRLGLPPGAVAVESGRASRVKRVRLTAPLEEELRRLLDLLGDGG